MKQCSVGFLIIGLFVLSACASPAVPPEPVQISPSNVPESYRISLNVFHDHNGNGIQEAGEPAIQGIELTYEPGGYKSVTGEDGKGTVNIPTGNYTIYINDPAKKFRYVLPSVSKVIAVETGLEVAVTRDTDVSLALGEGFLTLPFKEGTNYTQSIYMDLGNGTTWDRSGFTFIGHKGIDYDMPLNQVIVASASGVIIEAEGGWSDNPRADNPNLGLNDDGNRIIIDHGNGVRTIYAHLGDLIVRPRQLTLGNLEGLQKVVRGEPIAYSGNTGQKSMGPHLHFQVNVCDNPYDFGTNRDPYRNISDLSSISLWTKDNDPQYPYMRGYTEPGARNYYTFEEIVPLLNTPDKVSTFMKNNIEWDGKYDIDTAGSNEYVPASIVYERGIDDCDGHATLQAYLLKSNGYDAFIAGIGIEGPEGHNVCAYQDEGLYWTLDNCGVKKGPFNSLDELADSIMSEASIIIFDPFDINSITRDPFSLQHTVYRSQ